MLARRRTFVRVRQARTCSDLVPPEGLPCPGCHRVTITHPVYAGIEEVHCEGCGKVLRRRPALTGEQRAQAQILRWAAHEVETSMTTIRRRKPRGDSLDLVEEGMARVVDQLRGWSRLIHKVPKLRDLGE